MNYKSVLEGQNNLTLTKLCQLSRMRDDEEDLEKRGREEKEVERRCKKNILFTKVTPLKGKTLPQGDDRIKLMVKPRLC